MHHGRVSVLREAIPKFMCISQILARRKPWILK